MLVGARPFRDASCSAVVFRGEQGLSRFVEGCAAEFKVGDMRFGSGLAAIVGGAGVMVADRPLELDGVDLLQIALVAQAFPCDGEIASGPINSDAGSMIVGAIGSEDANSVAAEERLDRG